jgi:plasmid rolling circle replication initiator protein Rep
LGNKILSASYKRLGNEKKAKDVNLCASIINYAANPNNHEDKKLYQAYFCRCSLCPVCAMRRSEKLRGQTYKIVKHLDETKGYRYLFLSLTIRNMPSEELSASIDALMKGFNLLTKRKEFKALSKGWMRGLEVTHNWVTNEYHPHIHMLIAVDERYFTEYENYMNHWTWVELWKSCMHLDYDPSVQVKKVSKDKERKEKDSITYAGAVSELAKYPVKSNDYAVTWKGREYFQNSIKRKYGVDFEVRDKQHAEELTDRVVKTLTECLYNRRLVAFGGEMRKAHKLLNLDNPENGDLINTDQKEDEKEDGKYTMLLCYRFVSKAGNYILDEEASFRPIIRKRE